MITREIGTYGFVDKWRKEYQPTNFLSYMQVRSKGVMTGGGRGEGGSANWPSKATLPPPLPSNTLGSLRWHNGDGKENIKEIGVLTDNINYAH